MDGFIVWKGDHLEPADDRTREYLTRHSGEVLTVDIMTGTMSRDLVKHNQFHAIIDRCIDSMDYAINNNADRELAAEDLILKLKYEVGFTRGFVDINGIYREVPKSLSFRECREHEAEEFRVKAYAVLCHILKCSRAELFGF